MMEDRTNSQRRRSSTTERVAREDEDLLLRRQMESAESAEDILRLRGCGNHFGIAAH